MVRGVSSLGDIYNYDESKVSICWTLDLNINIICDGLHIFIIQGYFIFTMKLLHFLYKILKFHFIGQNIKVSEKLNCRKILAYLLCTLFVTELSGLAQKLCAS